MVIHRHIFRTVFIAILVTLIGFGIVEYVLAILNELNYNLAGAYQAKEAFMFITATAPGRLYQIFPFICLIGALFALGQLADHHELVAIESFAVSKPQIIAMSLTAPILWACIAFAVGETVVPKLDQNAYETRSLAAAKGSTRYGIWHRDQGAYYFFNAVNKDGTVEKGFSVQRDANDRLIVEQFERLTHSDANGWQFSGLNTLTVTPNSETTSIETDIRQWQTTLNPELLWLRTSTDAKLSVFKLWQYSEYLSVQNIYNNLYELKLWQRLFTPVFTIGMIFLAASFIFGPLRQSSTGARIFTGLMVAVIFNLLQMIIPPLSQTLNMVPVLAAAIPMVLVYGMSFVLQMRKT